MHPSQILRIPHRREVPFTGRDEIIASLSSSLTSHDGASKIHVLHGSDGIGKTRIAAEYTHRYAATYEFVGWLQGEEPVNFDIEFARLAAELDLPEKDNMDLRLVIKSVRRWLEQHKGWLLVVDGGESLSKIRPYLPVRFAGHVLVTSRSFAPGSPARSFPVSKLGQAESLKLLGAEKHKNDPVLIDLVRSLDSVPLALRIAGAYLKQTAMPYADYLNRLSTAIPDREQSLSLSAIYDPSFQQLNQLSPPGADLLGLCAFMAPNMIPLKSIQSAIRHLPDSLAEAAADPKLFKKAVGVLEDLSLAEVTDDTLCVHESIQSAVRDQLDDYDKKTYAEIAVFVLQDAVELDHNNRGGSDEILNLIPHTLMAAKHANEFQVASAAITSLLSQIGLYLELRCEFKAAERINRKALKIGGLTYGRNHPALAAIYKSLGDISRKLGDPVKGRTHYEKALAIAESAYLPDNPIIATLCSSIGEALHEAGDIAAAQEYFRRALSVDEAAYGSNHANLAVRLSKIGRILEELKEPAQAIATYNKLLQILELNDKSDSQEGTSTRARLKSLFDELERLAANEARYEQGMEATQRFMAQAGASIHQENERSFKIESVRGRLKGLAPLSVLVTTSTPIRQDVLDLFQSSQRLSPSQTKRAGIFIYDEQPDVFVQMQIAELRVRDGFVIVPIPLAAIEQALLNGTTCAGVLAHYSQHYLPGVDLFDDRNAIGDTLSFFGRSELLHLIEGDLVQLQPIGLFGLRKSGKTSVLLQLGLALRKNPVVHIDLQPYGGKERFGSSLFHEILQRLCTLLGDKSSVACGAMERFSKDVPAVEVSWDFVQAVNNLATELKAASYKAPILIFLDEVERLLPTPNDPRTKAEEFNAFFGALRALSQQQRKIGLLVADVHPDCNRINYWEHKGLPTNPVNQFFKELFLRPFSAKETARMIEDIGRLMGRSFDEEVLTAIHEQSGGHPFVARQLASLLTSKEPETKTSLIKWATVQQYVTRPFIYSGVLKDYFEQNIWGDMKIRGFDSAIAILCTLACTEGIRGPVEEQELFSSQESFTPNQMLDALLWLQSVALIGCKEQRAGKRFYKIKLPLLAQFILMQMSQKEIRQWQI